MKSEIRNPKSEIRMRASAHGFGVIEIVIVVAIVAGSFLAFLQTESLAVRLLRNEKENLEATSLARESLEAARAVRDESWTNNIAPLSNGPFYYPVIESGKWKLASVDPGLINGQYTRFILFEEVRRDAQDRISASGTIDPGTRKIVSSVLWGRGEEVLVEYTDGITDGSLASFPSENSGNGDAGQSFTTPASTSLTISSVELYLKHVSGTNPSDVYLEIRSGNTVGAVLATSDMVDSDSIPTAGLTWIKFNFQSPVVLSPSTQYFLRLRSTPSSTDAFSGSHELLHWGYRQTASSPYVGGDAWRYIGRLSNPSDQGQVLTQYDFSFRVYRETNTGKQKEIIAYITNFQESLSGPKEAKIVSFEDAPTDSNLTLFPSNNLGDGDPVQSFTTPASSTQITRADLFLKRATTTPADIFLEIRNSPTGAILGTSGIIPSATIPGSLLNWVTFRFPVYGELATSTVYHLRLRSIPSSTDALSGSVGPVHWGYKQSPPSPYLGGEARRYVGRLSNPNDTGELLDQYDFGFKVYALQ